MSEALRALREIGRIVEATVDVRNRRVPSPREAALVEAAKEALATSDYRWIGDGRRADAVQALRAALAAYEEVPGE